MRVKNNMAPGGSLASAEACAIQHAPAVRRLQQPSVGQRVAGGSTTPASVSGAWTRRAAATEFRCYGSSADAPAGRASAHAIAEHQPPPP